MQIQTSPRRTPGISHKINLNSPKGMPALNSPNNFFNSPDNEDLRPTASQSPTIGLFKTKNLDLPFEIRGSDPYVNLSTMRSLAASPALTSSVQPSVHNSISISFNKFGSRIQQKLLKLKEEFEEQGTNKEANDRSLTIRIPSAYRLVDTNHEVKEAVPFDSSTLEPHEFMIDSIPQLRYCAFCQAEVASEIEYVNDAKTFWSSVGIFMMGGVFGCFLLPYMVNSCKERRLKCRKCKRNF